MSNLRKAGVLSGSLSPLTCIVYQFGGEGGRLGGAVWVAGVDLSPVAPAFEVERVIVDGYSSG
jgi:hypothetical protein